MVQVLHLMSTEGNLHTERTSALIRRFAPDEISIAVRSIGRGGVYRNVGHAALSLRFGRGVPFDVIHAFDAPSLLAACAAPCPLIFSPSDSPGTVPAWWRRAMVYRNGTVIATTAVQRRRLISQGIPAPRCDVIPPPVDLYPALSAEPEHIVRSSLGLSPEDHVILAPSESNRSAGHLLALHAVSILHVLDPRCRMLIWGRGQAAGRLERLARLLRQPRLLVSAEPRLGRPIEFERLVRLADLALIASPQLPAMATAMCMAAALPIISGVSPSCSELLQDGLTASLAPKFAPRLIAQRLLQAIENPAAATVLGRNARSAAERRFQPMQAVRRFISLYRHAAGVSPKRAADEECLESVLSK